MTDRQTLLVPRDARRVGGRPGRFLTASVALALAWLVPALAVAQAPAVAPAPPGPQLIGLLPSLIGGDAANDFNTAMVSQLSTYPGGSSAGGFTFTFNPTTQAFARNSESFGPSFAERAMTMGRDTFNVGVTFQRATYDTFEGLNLGNGDVRFRVDNQPNTGDVIDAQLSIDLSTDIVVLFMSYGLTDRLDVGTVVPIIRVDFNASIAPTLVGTSAGPLPFGQRVTLPVQARTGPDRLGVGRRRHYRAHQVQRGEASRRWGVVGPRPPDADGRRRGDAGHGSRGSQDDVRGVEHPRPGRAALQRGLHVCRRPGEQHDHD